MGNRGVLRRNYFIYPETVSEYGAKIESVMTETDRAMDEASEIIAEIASLTERIPSQIRSGELLELCETAQAEIRSFDFLSYGKRVNQGLQNLLDQNQYITENFIKKMEATTERMREFGAGCRRLTELIDYSGGSLPLKGLALSAVSNAEGESTDGEEENDSKQSSYDVLMRAGAAEVLEVDVSKLEEIHALLENVSIENFEKLLQIYENGSYITYDILCTYMNSLIEEHYLTQSDYESLKGYIPNLRNTPSEVANINRNQIIELLTDRKKFINSIDNKIAEAYDNRSSDNPRTIVEYQLIIEYRDELLEGIITIEELEEVIDILERKNPTTFINIGELYISSLDACDSLTQKTIEPYIFATEHVSVELLNNLEWKYVNEEHVSELRLVMVKYDITTVERLRHFLAQCDVESGTSEDLLEDGHGIGKFYEGYCGAGRIQITLEAGYYAFAIYEALECCPELEEWVTYPNPAHNNLDSILAQYKNLCKAAYINNLDISEFTKIVMKDDGPKYVAENYAWESAGYYWYINNCNDVVDSFIDTEKYNADEITQLVNGNALESHYAQKREAYEEIKEYIQ